MPASVASILSELKRIARRSPEDVSVLMAPLVRAFEEIEAGRDPKLDHAQMMAMANSLAQTSAQAGNMDVAVAIAALSADMDELPPEVFEVPSEPPPQAAPEPPAPPTREPAGPLRHFAHLDQQLLGILAVCGLSYGGYLHIQARFLPGSITGWLLTGSASLLTLGLALWWRRFVLTRDLGRNWTMAALGLALVAGGWSIHARLDLHPQVAAMSAGGPPAAQRHGELGAGDRPTAIVSAGPADAGIGTDRGTNRGTAAGVENADADAGIDYWWMGVAPETPARAPNQASVPVPSPAPAPATATNQGPTDEEPTGPSRNADLERYAQSFPPLPPKPEPPELPQRRPDTPRGRYEALLDRRVVVVDRQGARHEGMLTGVSKDGVTVRTEVMMFGEPILANRFYLFDNIQRLSEK
jgi:hypothetical protein